MKTPNEIISWVDTLLSRRPNMEDRNYLEAIKFYMDRVERPITIKCDTEEDKQKLLLALRNAKLKVLNEAEITQGEWIPVSEKLPDDMQKVLVWFEYYRYGDFNCMYQTYGFGYVRDGEWSPFINGETGWQDARIIAWMPLPEPYKEEEK